jgi:hypothetical protein
VKPKVFSTIGYAYMKKQKARGAPLSSCILAAQSLLKRGVPPVDVVGKLRNEAPIEGFQGAIQWIRSNRIRMRSTLHDPFPRLLSELKLYSHSGIKPVNWRREFSWAAAWLFAYSDQLRRFASLQSDYQSALLSDSHATCTKILNEIQADLGYSLWYVKRRIHLLQVAESLDAQKRFAQEIREAVPSGNMAAYLAYYVSIRNEPSVTIGRFRDQFEENLSAAAQPTDFAAYLRYHITPDLIRSPEEAANLLRFESYGSVVDYYETFVDLIRTLALYAADSDRGFVLSLARVIYSISDDPRVAAVVAGMGEDVSNQLEAHFSTIRAYDSFLRGDYAQSRDTACEAITEYPNDLDALYLLSCLSALGLAQPDSVSATQLHLIQKLSNLLRHEPGALDDSVDLIKIGMNTFGTTLSALVMAVVASELTSDPLGLYSDYARAAAMSLTALHPDRVQYLTANESHQYAARLKTNLEGVAPSVPAVWEILPNNSTEVELLSSEQLALRLATQAYTEGEYRESLSIAQPALASTHTYFRARAVRLICSSLVKLGEIREALQLVTDTYLAERGWYSILPIESIADHIASDGARVYASLIATPILFDIYGRYVGNRYESERVFAFLDFLESHNYSRPTELLSGGLAISHSELVYFLRHICVESVMDRAGIFDSSRAVLEERLSICRRLVEVDEDAGESYHSEIKGLLRRLMVQQRMKEVEQSKIYVDTDGIKRKVEDELRELFNRYRALRMDRTDAFDTELVLSAVRKATEGDRQDLVSLTLPQNESAELFGLIIRRVRDEYVSSPEHGLDKYLSVRIRHGTLAAHLRRPVETAKLVTARELGSVEYKRNEFWEARLWADDESMKFILQRLEQFSREFDEFVNEIKSWIQIKKDGSPGAGLFDFTLHSSGVRVLSEALTADTSFEAFIDNLFENFGLSLDLNLERVRAQIQSRGKVTARHLLDGLATDIARFGDNADVGELINAIRSASTDLQVALDRITAWFERASTAGSEPFSVQDTIELSVEAVRTLAPDFQVEIGGNVTEPIMLGAGPYLTIFVDVFFIIFENIVRHSGLSDHAASVALNLRDATLTIRVENFVGDAIAIDEVAERLGTIRRAIHDDKQGSIVSREGGTGFHKLRRILTHDLLISNPQLDFGFMDDERVFYVNFSIPLRPDANPDR